MIVYPSPLTGNQLLNIEVNNDKINTVEIFDVVGKRLKYVNWSTSNLKLQLDITDISPGIYHIKVETESKVKFNSTVIKL